MYSDLDSRSIVTVSIATSCCIFTALIIPKCVKKWYQKFQLAKKRKEKQKQLAKNKETFGRYLEKNPGNAKLEKQILSLKLCQLIKKLRNKEFQPKDVLLAYQRKAYEVDKQFNCVVEFFYPDYSEIDLTGPFAGLPISIKDNFSYKGYDSCIGCSVFIDDPMKEDCSPVKVLKKLGAVPFCKTAVPQTMISALSVNPIDGCVLNPWNISKSPGGSSSGEGALIAAKGSLLGLGSDIGGSIRIPSSFCGIQGFKPTFGRLTYEGFQVPLRQKAISASWGPMAQDVQSLIFFMQQICDENIQYDLDPTVPITKFNCEELSNPNSIDYWSRSTRKLRIGYYIYDKTFKAVPAVERAVLETKEKLQEMGHELVEWDPPLSPEEFPFMRLLLQAISSDGGQCMKELLEHDEVIPSLKLIIKLLPVPVVVRQFIAKILMLCGQQDFANLLSATVGFSNVYELWKYCYQLNDYRHFFIQKWKENKLDAVICPGTSCPATNLICEDTMAGALSYTFLYNVVNFPAGIVTVTKVTQEDIDKMSSYPRTSMWHRAVADMQTDTVGLPVSVQCATLPWRDELCLRVMMDIQTAFQL